MVDPAVVKDLTDYMMLDEPIITEPAQAKSSSKGKRKAPAPLVKDQDQIESKKDVMELTFPLKNIESVLSFSGTVIGPDGTIKYLYKKLDKKSKANPTVQADPSPTHPSTTQAAAPAAAASPTTTTSPTTAAPTTTQVAVPTVSSTMSTTQDTSDSNNDVDDVAQYIEDFKKKMFEKMEDNELLQVMCHNFFSILMNTVAKKPISGSVGGKLNAIQVMANAMRAKEDTQTDKQALISYLSTRSSAKNYLKKALKMKEDNTKSVEELTDMFLDKLKE